MALQAKSKFNELRVTLMPILAGLAFAGVCALIIWAMQGHHAAVLIGILTAAILYYLVLQRAQRTTQLGILWAAVMVSADAAYAKLNDQTPVTVVNAIAKLAEALVKLGEGIVRSVGIPTADARTKMAAVTPDFIWALILTTIVLMALNFLAKRRG